MKQRIAGSGTVGSYQRKIGKLMAYDYCISELEKAYAALCMDWEVECEENGKDDAVAISMQEDLELLQKVINKIKDEKERTTAKAD